MKKLVFLSLFILCLSACQAAAGVNSPSLENAIPQAAVSTSTPAGWSTSTNTPPVGTPTPIQISEEWTLWNNSPHKNTTQNIGCATCHGTNPGKIENGSALCTGCHQAVIQQASASVEKTAHSGFKCLTCHDPHSAAASCLNAGCHAGLHKPGDLPPATPDRGHPANAAFCGGANCHPAATQAALSNPTIHGARHAGVSCAACHDASGLKAGPSRELGMWVTYRMVEIDGTSTSEPFVSHSMQRNVDCARCHFEGNEWGLPLVTGNEFPK